MSSSQAQKFKIGAVERLTGIPAVTLRMWERRYGVVEPERTAGNGRLYSRAQLNRLSALKRLVDAGHAISTIAPLSDVELSERAETLTALRPDHSGPVSLIVVGANLATQATNSGLSAGSGDGEESATQIVGSYEGVDAALSGAVGTAKALVVEQDIITADSIQAIAALTDRFESVVTVVVYQFASSAQLAMLVRAGFHVVSAPARLEGLQNMLPALAGAPSRALTEEEQGPAYWVQKPAASRRYAKSELQAWARRSNSVRCECPEHLVELINRLSAFEDYSRHCENGNPADAELHKLLHHTTAHARRALEDALGYLVAHEFPDDDG